jgi:thiamine pyrophosphate-dependent acetolactate synthase large subunit-like protein
MSNKFKYDTPITTDLSDIINAVNANLKQQPKNATNINSKLEAISKREPKNANKINSKPEGSSKLESKITTKVTSNLNDNETAKDKKDNSAKNKRTKLK